MDVVAVGVPTGDTVEGSTGVAVGMGVGVSGTSAETKGTNVTEISRTTPNIRPILYPSFLILTDPWTGYPLFYQTKKRGPSPWPVTPLSPLAGRMTEFLHFYDTTNDLRMGY
jgi:hypothetical protein